MAPADTATPKLHASDIGSIKAFADSNGDSPIPSSYYSIVEARDDVADHLASSFPVIDFSLLTSPDPQLHADAVSQLGKACAEWGFFMLTNHGISEKLMKEVMDKSHEFHNLPVEEKKEFADKGPLTSIRHGTSFYPESELFHYWRDYLKVMTLPEFNFPHNPPGFKKWPMIIAKKNKGGGEDFAPRDIESLGLEANAIIESAGFDSELALGMPPHTDHGLLTLLYQNGIGGLQVNHDGRWVNVNPLPNCLIVNTADQLEAVSNGRYKSIWHRADQQQRHKVKYSGGKRTRLGGGDSTGAGAGGERGGNKVQEDEVRGVLLQGSKVDEHPSRGDGFSTLERSQFLFLIILRYRECVVSSDAKHVSGIGRVFAEKQDFNISGPTYLKSVDWNNASHRRCVLASLIQGVYVHEHDRREKRTKAQCLALPWWHFFHFHLIETLFDTSDRSVIGAVLELTSNSVNVNVNVINSPNMSSPSEDSSPPIWPHLFIKTPSYVSGAAISLLAGKDMALSGDNICRGYIGYFEQRLKMKWPCAKALEDVATKHTLKSLIMSNVFDINSEPGHLIPSAELIINQAHSPYPRVAHGIQQWWDPTLLYHPVIYRYR
ncbi:hypothetical protein K1719_044778 [Acacia pycnantha]|nr:hypothetical protein K1719_044778 [Acacia pycnantha]